MFSTNQYVYYPAGGICRIEDIRVSPLSSMPENKLYYILRPIHEETGIIYLPTDSETLFIRPLITKSEAEKLIKDIPSAKAFETSDSKQLRQSYQDALNSHKPMEWVRIVKTLHYRLNPPNGAKPPKVSETERNCALIARRNLITELSVVLGERYEDLESLIKKEIAK